jgi:hypothetical protein
MNIPGYFWFVWLMRFAITGMLIGFYEAFGNGVVFCMVILSFVEALIASDFFHIPENEKGDN